jgi:hypothetical protein
MAIPALGRGMRKGGKNPLQSQGFSRVLKGPQAKKDRY